MQLTEEEWRGKLTPEQYRVLREQGTEAPFSGDLVNENRDGMYVCAACGAELFNSGDKYDSHIPGLAGWPSFADVIDAGNVSLSEDNRHGMHRTEVTCKNCGSHLGHVFDGDPDSPSGKHYCINSVSLQFDPQKEQERA